jgi:hypothetical protein
MTQSTKYMSTNPGTSFFQKQEIPAGMPTTSHRAWGGVGHREDIGV